MGEPGSVFLLGVVRGCLCLVLRTLELLRSRHNVLSMLVTALVKAFASKIFPLLH